ncbi:MAG: SAM-dependent chlorinase/fluorinase, partial [Acidobacteriales bacterium]|nr:SAM-dependent chlorinase/fluorinase [Terriglobales bacterium]
TIAQAYSYFPAGTIHVVVVDPGVGTTRRPIVASTERHRFVAPDNGVLSLIYGREERLRVHHVTSDHYFLQPVSNTFHARDIFAPVAAYLAKGVEDAKFGPPLTEFVRFNAPKPKAGEGKSLRGVVLKVDRFGNLVTNITPSDAPALFQSPTGKFKITIGSREITSMHAVYAEGEPKEVFAILGSMGYLEISANRGAAAQVLGAGKGSEVNLVFEDAVAAGNGM